MFYPYEKILHTKLYCFTISYEFKVTNLISIYTFEFVELCQRFTFLLTRFSILDNSRLNKKKIFFFFLHLDEIHITVLSYSKEIKYLLYVPGYPYPDEFYSSTSQHRRLLIFFLCYT